MSTETYIPEITDERLAELMERIKPVVRIDGALRYIEPVDPRRVAFTWSAKPTGFADGLKVHHRTVTRHLYGAPVFFKPSIAEVLAQLPEDNANIVAFIVADGEDLDYSNVDSRGFHVVTTTWLAVDPHANPANRTPRNEGEAKALGWTVDRSTYPWKAVDPDPSRRGPFSRLVDIATPEWEPFDA